MTGTVRPAGSPRRLAALLVTASLLAFGAISQPVAAAETLWDRIVDEHGTAQEDEARAPVMPASTANPSIRELLDAHRTGDASIQAWASALRQLWGEGANERLAELTDACLGSGPEPMLRRVCNFYRALGLSVAGRVESAAAALEGEVEFQQLDALGVTMMANLAELKAALGDFETARLLYHRVLEFNPSYVTSHLGLAIIHLKLGEWGLARAAMRPVIEAGYSMRRLAEEGYFFVPPDDQHLVALLFAMIQGDVEAAKRAVARWKTTPSANRHLYRTVATGADELLERMAVRAQKLPLPEGCYPDQLAYDAARAMLVVECVDQVLYRYRAEPGEALASDPEVLPLPPDDAQWPISDIQIEDDTTVRLLRESGLIVTVRKTGSSWATVSRVQLPVERTRAIQLVGADRVLIQDSTAGRFSIRAIEDFNADSSLSPGDHRRSFTDAHATGDGRRMFALSNDGSVVFGLPAASVIQTLEFTPRYRPYRAALSSDGRFVVVQLEREVLLYSTWDGQLVDVWPLPGTVGIGTVGWVTDDTIVARTNEEIFVLTMPRAARSPSR